MCRLLSFYSRPALIILSRASFILSSFAQRLMRMYRLPLLPKMNPGVMNTLALWSTASVKSSTSAYRSGIFPQRNIPTCFGSKVHPKAFIMSSAMTRRRR